MKREDFQFRAGEKAIVRLNTEVRVIDEDKRIVEYIGSDESVDRYGTSLRGWQLKQYRKNPVFLYGHDHYFPPIGAAKRVWLDPEKNLRFRIQYVPEELFPFAGFVFKMVQGRWIRATSVGFIPGDVRWPTEEQYREDPESPVLLLDNELLELSQVTVPANPNALANAFRSLKPSTEYAGYIAANAKLPHEGLIDGRDSDSLREDVLGWSREVAWDGEIEDESKTSVAVHPDTPVDEERGNVTVVTVVTVESEESETEVSEPAEPAEPAEPETPEPEAPAVTVVINAAPTFTVSWDAIGAGMARMLLGDYEDDDVEEEFGKLVAGYGSHEKTLPEIVLPSGERKSIVDVEPDEMERLAGAVELVFHHGEDALWASKRAMILGDAPEKPAAAPAVAPPNFTAGGAPTPSFGSGGGGGSVSRAPARWSGQKPSGGDGLMELREQLLALRQEVVSMQDEAESADDVRTAVADLDNDISGIEDALREMEADDEGRGAAEDVATAADGGYLIPIECADALTEGLARTSEGEAASGGDGGGSEGEANSGAPAPSEPSAAPSVNLDEVREMIRAEIAAAVVPAAVVDSDALSPSDLSDLAFTLGVPSWLDFRADGRTCADYVRALSEAASDMADLSSRLMSRGGVGGSHTMELAGVDLSVLLRRLDGIEEAVKAATAGKVRTAGAILASRRGASEKLLGESLGEVAKLVERKVAGVPGRRTLPPIRKRNGRGNWWGVTDRQAD